MSQALHLDDSQLGVNVLNELRLLWQRTKGMNRQVREAVFVMGSDLLRRYPVNTSSVATRQMRRYAKDFLNGHYWKWEVDGWIGVVLYVIRKLIVFSFKKKGYKNEFKFR